VDGAVDRVGRRHVEQRQVRVDRLGPPVARDGRVLEQRLDLGAEDHALARQLGVVERLDAEAVAREQQTAGLRVPDREGEHPPEPIHAALAPLLVAMDDDLGVGARAEAMAVRDEFGADLGEVVDLAVEDDLDRAVLVAERLVAGRQVDDAQAAVPEADAGAVVVAAGIGPRCRTASVIAVRMSRSTRCRAS
jgi:hypothetical protein